MDKVERAVLESLDKIMRSMRVGSLLEEHQVREVIATGHVPNNHWQDRHMAEGKLRVAISLREILLALD